MTHQPLAVIDIGSNSGRVEVVELIDGHLSILADARIPLRLAADLRQGRLSAASIDRAIAALHDFRAIARGAGAQQTIAVATSAVRESSNRDELINRAAKETGIELQVISGETESRYSFLGAVHGLAVDSGLLVDIGGGSVELSIFRNRRSQWSATLPLGSLRMSTEFLSGDPPTPKQIRNVREHIREVIDDASLPAIPDNGVVVGTGGSVRALARVDRNERGVAIVTRVHGYELDPARVSAMAATLASRTAAENTRVRGLNADRADSIVGGAIVLDELLLHAAATVTVVAGQGLREGVAYDLLAGSDAPSPEKVRATAVGALCRRFATWHADAANRRGLLATTIFRGVLPEADQRMVEMLSHAATILDAGASIDHYNRSPHAATIVLQADLTGFTHTDLIATAFIIRRAENDTSGKSLRRALPEAFHRDALTAAAALALADAIQMRLPPGAPGTVTCDGSGGDIVLRIPISVGSWARAFPERFRTASGRSLRIETLEIT